ncbi:hypothetical protein [Rhodovulum adriaticum]|uniref:Glycosyl transferase family 2 n=1 Tax=Rhodovulum adriaticum TaxID=35804 RepID=A0A4R2P091_RHOAD|nr:hypothetical protein [Rhodovulum adriaticum]MBK1634208.1 hypothetical protein [Rhodovulum adriaticum]TCP27241.1 hypothetical protein EV656_101144 [Rhodovulum adriaticum]
MIYFCVVHWKNTRWIGRQLRHIAGYTTGDYRIACFHTDLDGPIPEDSRWLFREETRIREHATKLDILAHEVCRQGARDDDILVFIDSDAFPVAPWEARLLPALDRHELTAVQRLENFGSPQPHPCFCATTVGFWRRIGGTWASGHKWRSETGAKVTDVGGNLLKHLEAENIDWAPLLRSNAYNPHPLWFGLYADAIYHHGAGSRGKLSPQDHDRITQRLSRLDHDRIMQQARERFPLRMRVLDRLAAIKGRNRLLAPLRRALTPQAQIERDRAAIEAQIATLSTSIEDASDDNLLTPDILNAILRSGA